MPMPYPRPPRRWRELRSLRDHRRRAPAFRHVVVGRLGLIGPTVTAIVAPNGAVVDMVFGPRQPSRTIH